MTDDGSGPERYDDDIRAARSRVPQARMDLRSARGSIPGGRLIHRWFRLNSLYRLEDFQNQGVHFNFRLAESKAFCICSLVVPQEAREAALTPGAPRHEVLAEGDHVRRPSGDQGSVRRPSVRDRLPDLLHHQRPGTSGGSRGRYLDSLKDTPKHLMAKNAHERQNRLEFVKAPATTDRKPHDVLG